MSQNIEVKVPDIGGFSDVPVIEIAVKVGDTVQAEDSLITLESDKATMDVPAPAAGVVKEIKVSVGDKVSEGSFIVLLEAAGSAASAPSPLAGEGRGEGAVATATSAPLTPSPLRQGSGQASPTQGRGELPAAPSGAASVLEVKVPDIGGFSDVPVIEIAVKVGDTVQAEDSLITLESDKATMDVPSPAAGVVKEIKVSVGDKVSEGSFIVLLEAAGSAASAPSPLAGEGRGEGVAAPAPTAPASSMPAAKAAATVSASSVAPPKEAEPTTAPAVLHMPTPGEMAVEVLGGHKAHASPSVRAFARELGADVSKVGGSGPKGRITREDVVRFIKGIVSGASSAPAAVAPAAGGVTGGGTLDLLPWPKVDFAKFGAVEVKPLSRIKKISGANLARNWVMIPHVTQFDEADITDLEAFRVQTNKENEKGGSSGNVAKLTMLAFLIKACVAALKKYPEFNASLDGDNLVLKQYFHIGFAADTPNGLVVPVIRDCDKKGLLQIAQEMGDLAKKARDGKLGPADMTGGCFSISSLGGIGGTAFTPIINAPEVAILGVSKTQVKPVWDGKQFVPKQMLPLSLSYDHRVIDGASAARFTSYLASLLVDLRRVSL